jgi:hypothetical protein
MKKEKSQEEKLFDRFAQETKDREEELFSRHKQALKLLEDQEKELQQMQESLNENERSILQNLEEEVKALKEKLEDLELRKEAELELLDEEIEKTGRGYSKRLDRSKVLDDEIEKFKADHAQDIERLELLVEKARLKVLQGELKYLDKKQIFEIGRDMFRQNLDFFYKSKINDLSRLYASQGRLQAIILGIGAKMQEIGRVQDKIWRIEGGPDTSTKRIQQARGKIITTGGDIK